MNKGKLEPYDLPALSAVDTYSSDVTVRSVADSQVLVVW
jgi:hypothetical protein